MQAAATLHPSRPRLRGYVHLVAAIVAPFALIALLARAHSAASYAGAAVFGAGMMGLFSVSASYHLYGWNTRFRPIFRRLDHSMIFIAVAAFYTPFCLQVLGATWGVPMLILVWTLAGLGAVLKHVWLGAPQPISLAAYILTGWVALAATPRLAFTLEAPSLLALLLAGVLFTVGGVIYAIRRPNPFPGFAGHHELFHALVTLGCAVLFVVVFVDVLPR
ncbi:MAG: hemolysin III family protein [Dehalococcoidia bacterium]|nr:hemolysin III family protein [Dehalococcoidia bacterium]